MCARAFCDGCGEELIHRDHRKHYESSSGLGQIVRRDMTDKFGVTDIDLAVERTRGGVTLLKLVEQKQERHRFRGSQAQIMAVLAALIDHAKDCADFTAYQLAPDSGAYVAYGEIVPETGVGSTMRQKLWLPGQLIVDRLGGDPSTEELTRLDFLLWLASTADERQEYSRGRLLREFLKPGPGADYFLSGLPETG